MLLKKTILYQTANNILNLDPYRIVYSILSDGGVQEFIKSLNKDQLFDDNLDSNDNKLVYRKNGRIYTGYSSLYFELLGGVKENGVSFNVGDPYTISNSGKFYNSINVKVSPDISVDFTSDPIKIDESGNKTNLYDAFGGDILGLSDTNLQKLIDEILEQLIPQILQEVLKHS